jgi:hypothetical protein
VHHSFEDNEVLVPDFMQKLSDILKVMRPLVYWYVLFISLFSLALILFFLVGSLNDMMTVNGGGGGGDEDKDKDEGDEDGENEDEEE